MGRHSLYSAPVHYVCRKSRSTHEHAMQVDRANVKSRTGYIMMFAEFQVKLASKLLTETALSTTKADVRALNKVLCTTITIMNPIYELREKKWDFQAKLQSEMH